MSSTNETLQDFLDRTPDLVDYLYNDTEVVHFSRASGQKVPAAFSNWREEQTAAVRTATLLHQTHNMPELLIEGPGAFDLLKSIAVNTFENFAHDRAKQFIACTPSGYLIGDCILYRHGEETFEVVSGAPVLNWIEYNAHTGGHDVSIVRDDASNINPTGRRIKYRFELAGPCARTIFDRIVEGGAPDIPFFRTRTVRIGGHNVVALRHGMVGSFAVELSGPYGDESAVRSLILQCGEEFGLKPSGMTAYYTNLQGGWIPYPVPGIFTDPELDDYRRYLPATTFEVNTELGGSFVGSSIEDYYATPFDFGYGHVIKFDHDFHGRESLALVPDEAKRTKRTLVWNRDDVARVFRSQFGSGARYKSIEFPHVTYAWNQFDEVRSHQDDLIGLSRHAAYVDPVGDVISLAVMNHGHGDIDSEVVITWGEPNGGSRKRQVEPHEQTTIRARVAPAPLARDTQRVAQRAEQS